MRFISKNMGKKDRLMRLFVGIIFLIASVYLSSYIFLLIALFCFFQAMFSWCLYHALTGKNTCPLRE